MSNKKIIPFSWYPAHWGLTGKAKEMALANFELEGEDLLRKKIDININERTDGERKIAHLELDHKTDKITNYKLAKGVIQVNINEQSDNDVTLALLKLKLEYNKISKNDYEKERASVLGEPWVVIKTLETDPKNPKMGGVELDWNDMFVENLEKHGYGPNPDDEDTVNDWFNELCRNIALEAYAGIGDFEDQVGTEDAPKAPQRTNIHEDAIVVNPKPEAKKTPKKDEDK